MQKKAVTNWSFQCISMTTLFKQSQLNLYFDKTNWFQKNTINLLIFETLHFLKMGPNNKSLSKSKQISFFEYNSIKDNQRFL